jgi:hypothetical protein
MRLKNEAPVTQFETEVENILVNNGYRRDNIQFRDSDRYLRVGYWECLSDKVLDQLKPYIKEVVDMYDDDYGMLLLYRLNH